MTRRDRSDGPERAEARDLFLRCADGDEASWGEFRERYGALLAFLVRKELARRGPVREADVEDCLGDLHLLLLKDGGAKLRGYETRFRPSTWLVLSVVTAVRDRARKEARFVRGREEGEGFVEGAASEVAGPGEEVAAGDLANRISEVASRLPAREQLALRMSLAGGRTNREIARVLKLSEAATSRLLDRARGALRRLAGDARA